MFQTSFVASFQPYNAIVVKILPWSVFLVITNVPVDFLDVYYKTAFVGYERNDPSVFRIFPGNPFFQSINKIDFLFKVSVFVKISGWAVLYIVLRFLFL
jgi:hypothetical protein